MNEMIAIILSVILFMSTLYIYLMIQIFRIDDKISALNDKVSALNRMLRELREKGGEE